MAQPVWMVFFADRFGEPFRDVTNQVVGVSASPLRVVDNISSLNLDLITDGYDLFCDAKPWATEIQLYADGEIAWAGPIEDTDFEWGTGAISISARDLLAWLDVRILRERIEAGPVSQQFFRIIELAMADDDIGLDPPVEFVSAEADLRVTDLASAGKEIVDLAPFLDFTMQGRELLVGAEEIPFADLPGTLLLPEMVIDFTLRRSGSEEASQFWMRGGDNLTSLTGEEAVSPTTGIENERATGSYPVEVIPDPDIGVVQRVDYDTSILSDLTARKAAYSAYQYARPPLFSIDAALNMGNAPFRFNQLIAGSTVTVSIPNLECFPTQTMRIKTIGLEIDAVEGGGLNEEVSVALIPAGIFDDDLATIT